MISLFLMTISFQNTVTAQRIPRTKWKPV